jgi:transposase
MELKNYSYFDRKAVAEAARLKKLGYTTKQMASRLNVSRQAIWRWLKLYNIKGRPGKYDGKKRGRIKGKIIGLTEPRLAEIREIMKTSLPSELNLPYQEPRFRVLKSGRYSDILRKGEYFVFQNEMGKLKKYEIKVEKWYSATIKELVKIKFQIELSDYQARKILVPGNLYAFFRNPTTGKIEVVAKKWGVFI